MPEPEPAPAAPRLEALVADAQRGDRRALEAVVRAIQPDVHRLALRFLWHPQDAEDAAQEILVRVVTRLGTFRGRSAFRTWVYRVACNALLSARKGRMEARALSLEGFAADLERGLSMDAPEPAAGSDDVLLLEEIKIGCTLAMLLGLDRGHRLAYILGEILELGHLEAARALGIAPAAYRKRLSRARGAITALMQARCGLVEPANACRCRRRVGAAIAGGRVDPARLLFASSREQAGAFPGVLLEIRRLDEAQRAAALHRSHRLPEPSARFEAWLAETLARTP